ASESGGCKRGEDLEVRERPGRFRTYDRELFALFVCSVFWVKPIGYFFQSRLSITQPEKVEPEFVDFSNLRAVRGRGEGEKNRPPRTIVRKTAALEFQDKARNIECEPLDQNLFVAQRFEVTDPGSVDEKRRWGRSGFSCTDQACFIFYDFGNVVPQNNVMPCETFCGEITEMRQACLRRKAQTFTAEGGHGPDKERTGHFPVEERKVLDRINRTNRKRCLQVLRIRRNTSTFLSILLNFGSLCVLGASAVNGFDSGNPVEKTEKKIKNGPV